MISDETKKIFELTGSIEKVMESYARASTPLADEQKTEFRMLTCSLCKSLRTQPTTCRLCGAYMAIKVRLDTSKCPLGKW